MYGLNNIIINRGQYGNNGDCCACCNDNNGSQSIMCPGQGFGGFSGMSPYQNAYMGQSMNPNQLMTQCLSLLVNLTAMMASLFSNTSGSPYGGNYNSYNQGNNFNNGNSGYGGYPNTQINIGNSGCGGYPNTQINIGNSGYGGYPNTQINLGNSGYGNYPNTQINIGNTGYNPYSTNGNTLNAGGPGVTEMQTDFQDGRFPGTAPQAQVPARIMTDPDGNKYLRLTANYGDRECIPNGEYPNRVRTTMSMTAEHQEMPELNDSNNHMSYSANIRFVDNVARRPGYSDNSFFELFQGSNKGHGTSYNDANSPTGPAARLIRNEKGHVIFETNQVDGNGGAEKSKQYDLGYYSANQFHNFDVNALWSNDPNKGGFAISIDGQQKLALRGSNYYNLAKSNLVPEMKVGLYGTNAVGSVDVDNVQVKNLSGQG